MKKVTNANCGQSSSLADSLAYRYVLEGDYSLVADAEENHTEDKLSEFYAALDEAESDAEFGQAEINLYNASVKLDNELPLIGGAIPHWQKLARLQYGFARTLTVCAPELLVLKRVCHRILLKSELNTTRIILVVDKNQVRSLSANALIEAGSQLRQTVEQEYLHVMQTVQNAEVDGKKAKHKKITKLKHWVVFNVLIINSGITDTKNNRSLLKTLKQHRIRNRVRINSFVLDESLGQVEASRPLVDWRRRRYLRYALQHKNESPSQIWHKANSANPSAILPAVVGAITALLVMFVNVLLAFMGYSLDTGFIVLGSFALATALFIGFVCLYRLNRHASVRAHWFMVSFIVVLGGTLVSVYWPPSLPGALTLGLLLLLFYYVNMMGAVLMEREQ
ncbi:hypothetical protein [Halioxenophilus aromaticivorans]|uniref:hypothetical protein n=1 Tax=Halioxenophilus aromaticivorans TaxID=1306992 RepID=UPI0031EB4A2E